jgi:phosphoribosylanthranilate isomerase
MSVFVKICGLAHADHVAAAIDAGVDAVGFVFAPSVREIQAAKAAQISANVPANIRRVAVMLHPTNDHWQKILADFGPDVLQTDAGDFAALDVPDSVERWPVFRQGRSDPDVQSAYVFEGPKKSGHGETVDWSQAAVTARQGKMILAGGLSSANVAEAIATVRPFGVDVSSAVESAPGQKDVALIQEFVKAAKAAEKDL